MIDDPSKPTLPCPIEVTCFVGVETQRRHDLAWALDGYSGYLIHIFRPRGGNEDPMNTCLQRPLEHISPLRGRKHGEMGVGVDHTASRQFSVSEMSEACPGPKERVILPTMSQIPSIPVAVAGIGHLGRHHLRLACTLPGWECVGAYDPDRSRLETLCAEFDARPLGSLEEALDRCQAVVVASPTVSHLEVCAPFLAAGRHVMVEKPIAATVEQARKMIDLAKAGGSVLAVGHVEFFNPAVQAVLGRSVRPRYIEAQRLSPFTARSLDIDVVLDLMVHDIQITQALCGGAPIQEIRAVGVPVLSNRVDLANVRLEMANGCVATLTASRVSGERVRKLRLFEPDAYYSVDYAEQQVAAYQLTRHEGSSRIEPVTVELTHDEPLAAEHRAFQGACRGERVPFVDGEAGTAALAAAVAVTEAIERKLPA